MQLSANGRQFLQSLEGLSLRAYPDPPLPKLGGQWQSGQLWSIGYGHQLGKGPQWEGYTITRDEADRLFRQDIAKWELAVSVTTPVATQEQFDAMVSLAYNIGTGGFSGSTVARLHNMGDYAGAADAFRLWKKAGGVDSPVLIARREKERGVYLHGYPGVYPEPNMSPAPAAEPIVWAVPSGAQVSSPSTLSAFAPGLALAGLGMIFFCPCCSAKLAVGEVRK